MLDPQRLEALGITRLGFTQSVLQGEAAATAMYLAPEVMSGQPATVQADIYALGILLYQMVVGDLKHPLAPGWEQRVDDALLREDIGLAVAGDPTRRLADAEALATRLRTLEERRQQREAEHAEKARIEQEQRAAEERARKAELAIERLRARRAWQRTVLAVLIVGVSISLGLYFDARRARNDAAAAAASSQAVASFLSKDLFAVVSSKPLHDLTVREMLESASQTLGSRNDLIPVAAAEIHAALGNAFLTIEALTQAEKHLGEALGLYERLEGPGSTNAVAVAARLASTKSILGTLADALPRLEGVVHAATDRLGPHDPALLQMRQTLAYGQLRDGSFADAAASLRSLLADQRTAPSRDEALIAETGKLLGFSLRHLGELTAAEAMLQEALAAYQAVPGSAPMAIAQARDFRAQVLIELERFDEAERELQDALQQSQAWALDQHNSLVLSLRFAVAQLRLRQGRTAEAVALLERLIQNMLAAPWNVEVDNTPEPRRWLGLAYAGLGRLDAAETALRRAAEIGSKTFGDKHPLRQAALIALADVVRLRHGADSAREVLASVDAVALGKLGPEHPLQAERRRVLGLVDLAEGKLAQAQTELREASRIFELRYGAGHSFSRRSREDLAKAELALRRSAPGR